MTSGPTTMQDGDITWLELPGGDDCRRTGRFYVRVFNWLVEDDGNTVWFREPSGRLGGAFRGDLPSSEAGPILSLAVADAAEALSRIVDAGGEVILDRTLIAPDVGYRALFRDPAGTTVGLFERSA
jgi:predicted enzyme related to lactoylglutathione lyase